MGRLYLSPPDVGALEREFLLDAFDSNWIAPLGPHVDGFEEELAAYVGVGAAAALASGTAALHLALQLVGVGEGDEVLCSTLTFVATANAIRYTGAQPVFIDSEVDTWNMDPQLLEEELADCAARGRLPKAVVVVDIFGQCADYEAIERICEAYGVPIIEDAAESLGAHYKGRKAGSFGKISCFSFNGNKIITTSGGGMLASDDVELVARARFLASQAKNCAQHYEHSELGYNYRMSNLLAALGRAQLRGLNDKIARRLDHFEYYKRHLCDLPGVAFMPQPEDARSNGWLACILVNPSPSGVNREQLMASLQSEDIEGRPVWKPLHQQPLYSQCRARGGAVAETLFRYGLCLPSGSAMTDQDRERVVAAIGRVFREVRKGEAAAGAVNRARDAEVAEAT
ncbi:DegT/DnrJ/EryC1/StrS family aminotransferase [Lentibacter algarum]|uniref:DegT/DnrJ/EryC1/StrS family aminotransferase n=1 Tax=Lentibacter algarum TaxID=576131 RepID=UPI003AF8B1A2